MKGQQLSYVVLNSSENISKYIGLCFRTGLDTKYVLLNDDKTGLLTYVGNIPLVYLTQRELQEKSTRKNMLQEKNTRKKVAGKKH